MRAGPDRLGVAAATKEAAPEAKEEDAPDLLANLVAVAALPEDEVPLRRPMPR